MLISETHFTDKSYVILQKYNYNSNNSDGKPHGGTALVENYKTEKQQASLWNIELKQLKSSQPNADIHNNKKHNF